MPDLNKERKWIFLCAVGLTLLGLLVIYEASSVSAWKFTGDQAYYVKRQAGYFAVSLVAFAVVLLLDFKLVRKYFRPLLLLNIALLVFVLILGKKTGGARRWLNFFGFTVQPSEFLKVTFFLYCMDYLQRKGALIRNFRVGLLPLLVVTGAMSLLIVMEPDLGSVIFWALWLFIILFLFNAKKRHLASVLVLGLIVCVALVIFCPYRVSRLVSYLNPWDDPQGSGFQLIQSQIAYGTGGIWGVGLGESKQKFLYLPAAHTDFIFSIIAEEFGFLGSIFMLGLFAVFIFRMLRLSTALQDSFFVRLGQGIAVMFALEICINIGVSCGLLPTKGLSLPFLSYGGSNFMSHFILLGILFNVSREDAVLHGNRETDEKPEQ